MRLLIVNGSFPENDIEAKGGKAMRENSASMGGT